MQVGERDLGGGNEEGVLPVELLGELEGVFFELRQLARPGHRGAAHDVGHHELGVAVGVGGLVQKEADQRALETGARTPGHRKASAGELCRPLEVEDPQRLAQGDVVLHGEVVDARAAPGAQLDVVVFGLSFRNAGVQGVGNAQQQVALFVLESLSLVVEGVHAVAHGLDLLPKRKGLVPLSGLHQRTDLLGQAVPLGPHGVRLGLDLPAAREHRLEAVEGRKLVFTSVAARQGVPNPSGVLGHQAPVQHPILHRADPPPNGSGGSCHRQPRQTLGVPSPPRPLPPPPPKGRAGGVADLGEAGAPLHVVGQRCHQIALHAAGVDAVVGLEIHLHVDGKAVPRHPAAAGNADGRDLLALNPDARVPGVRTALDTPVGQRLGADVLQAVKPAVEVVAVLGEPQMGYSTALARPW